MADDAIVVLRSEGAQRTVPLAEFYLGYQEMQLAQDELIEEIRVPLQQRKRERFDKVGSRRAQAIAKIGLATVEAADGWRVVAASLAPTVRRCPAVEALLDTGSRVENLEAFEAALSEDVTPIDDIRSTANYRMRVAARLLFYGQGSA